MFATASDLVSRPARKCGDCADGIVAPFPFTMAFQPVVDLSANRIYAYEALVRGPTGQSAPSVLSQVTEANRYAFDQSCRVQAISLATRLGIQQSSANLSINFIPGAMYRPEFCVRATLAAARRYNFPLDRLVFELTENERITDFAHLGSIFSVYRANSFRTALDDFGAGYSGLTLIAQFQPDVVKIDMALIRDIDTDTRRQAVVRAIVQLCGNLSASIVAEGVETRAELDALRGLGISLFQGYLFAKPGFECLPEVRF